MGARFQSRAPAPAVIYPAPSRAGDYGPREPGDLQAAQVVNSRLLVTGPWAEGDPLCPEDLMMGKARGGMPAAQFETGQLVRRIKAAQEAKEEFWNRWVKEIFPSLVKQRECYKYKRDAKVGDVVLRKDETAAGQTYKYGRIISVHVGLDGKVQSADVEYKVPGESKFRVTTRPIHRLVLVVPVEEQTMEEPEDSEDVGRGRSTGEETRTVVMQKGNKGEEDRHLRTLLRRPSHRRARHYGNPK
jgi:hypothetical protein